MARKKKTPEIQQAFNRILCFTTSYHRPYMLYNCINNILNQSFKDFKYYININIDNERDKVQYEDFLKDFKQDDRLSILYTANSSQHENYLKPIIHAGRDKYNLYIKIDDDDIYHKQYLESVIDLYKKNKKDILSCSLKKTINGKNIHYGQFESIGVWKPDTESKIKFGMPCTYVMNQSAVNVLLKMTPAEVKAIHPFEDPAWRTAWRAAKLSSVVIKDFDFATYHIHGKNSSSSYMYEEDSPNAQNIEYVENEFFVVALIKHKWWESYVYLNKRNNRMYHINNDDHGAFTLQDHTMKITWDNWGEEKFNKVKSGNKYYFMLQ